MKVLVTGGAGFVGSNIVDMLVKEGHSVVILDNLSTGFKENINPKAVFYELDLSEHKKVREIFEKEKPEIIYHLAAQIDIRKAVENPVFDAEMNIINSLNLLNLAVEFGIKHFIFSSSGGGIYEVGDKSAGEDSLEKPGSPYGCAKLAIDKYLNFYKEVHGLKFTSLRYANVYGPRQGLRGEAGVVAIFIKKMLKNENPIIFGGTQTRDFVSVEDVARANLLALKDNKSEIYNIGTGIETSITELFNKLNGFFDNKFKAEYQERKKGEAMRSFVDSGKIKSALGWVPEVGLDEGLRRTYEWCRSMEIS